MKRKIDIYSKYMARALREIGTKCLSTMGIEYSKYSEISDLRRQSIGSRGQNLRTGVDFVFVIPRYWRTHALFQVALAGELINRGQTAFAVTCNGGFGVCEIGYPKDEWYSSCWSCRRYTADICEAGGIPVESIPITKNRSEFAQQIREINQADIDTLRDYKVGSLPVGQIAVAPTRWRLRAHNFESHPRGIETYKEFIKTGLIWAIEFQKILNKSKPLKLVLLNGIFMEEAVAAYLAKQTGAEVIFFERGRKSGTLFFSRDVPAPYHNIEDSWAQIKNTQLTPAQDSALTNIIMDRKHQKDLVEKYWHPSEPLVGKDWPERSQKRAVLFTNVVWDTSMQGIDDQFADMFDWIAATIEIFRNAPNWHLVIRAHPAEVMVPGRESYEKVADFINESVTPLPDNVEFIDSKDSVNSYALMDSANCGIVYGSTTGLEMAVSGKPVVVAARAHFSRKGFTYDVTSRQNYKAVINEALTAAESSVGEIKRELARKYAYAFFILRTWPMALISEDSSQNPRILDSVAKNKTPSSAKIVDEICHSMINRRPFHKPED